MALLPVRSWRLTAAWRMRLTGKLTEGLTAGLPGVLSVLCH